MGIAINLAKLLGAQPFFIDVDEQDATAAITEDLPVVVSAALMQSGAGSQSWREIQRLAGRSYARATEPCAVDSKQLQRRIVANREKVLTRLDAFSHEIEQVKQMLVSEQEEALIQYFEQAHRARSSWLNARARGDWAGDELPKVPDVDTSLMRQLLGLGKRQSKSE